MKLKELINNVDTSEKNFSSVCHERLGESLNIHDTYGIEWDKFEEVFKSYWLTCWRCTDTWVGVRVLFVENVAVGVIEQSARKSDMNFSFISQELALYSKKKLIELLPNNDKFYILTEEELEADEGEYYTIQYADQCIEKTGTINNQTVKIIKPYPYQDKERYFHTVLVEYPDGKIEDVDIREMKFGYHITKS